MNGKTKISVITIAYNSEKTIEQTIRSVIAQNYDNLEYIIIDGASNDSTLEIIKKYTTVYPFIKFRSEADNGISDAFNKGIALATGKLIGLINSDDQLAYGALDAIDRTYRETGADVIYGNAIVDDIENGLRLYKKAGKPEQLKYEMPFIHQSCFICKHVYDSIGRYSEEYNICMDYDMLARIYKQNYKFFNCNVTISIFQYGGTSCKHPIKTINQDMEIAAKYGLSRKEVFTYKLKHIPINLAKLLLSRLKVWGWIYRKFKKDSVKEN